MVYRKAPAAKPHLAEEAKALYIKNNSNVQQEPAMLPSQTTYGLSALRANLFQIADAALPVSYTHLTLPTSDLV